MHTELIDKIIALAQGDDEIRAVILEGSVVAGAYTDDLSDYDVNIYARDYGPYLIAYPARVERDMLAFVQDLRDRYG